MVKYRSVHKQFVQFANIVLQSSFYYYSSLFCTNNVTLHRSSFSQHHGTIKNLAMDNLQSTIIILCALWSYWISECVAKRHSRIQMYIHRHRIDGCRLLMLLQSEMRMVHTIA